MHVEIPFQFILFFMCAVKRMQCHQVCPIFFKRTHLEDFKTFVFVSTLQCSAEQKKCSKQYRWLWFAIIEQQAGFQPVSNRLFNGSLTFLDAILFSQQMPKKVNKVKFVLKACKHDFLPQKQARRVRAQLCFKRDFLGYLLLGLIDL